MSQSYIKTWLKKTQPPGVPSNITVLNEQAGKRALVLDAVKKSLLDHLIGLEIIKEMGGFAKAASVIQNTLPQNKKTRSGDFGEILATEYMEQVLEYTVPIRKLRYKDDREMSMRGDDTIGFRFQKKPPSILKTEAKSRISLSRSVVTEAADGLKRHNGRPNPSTLSFISRRLREQGKDDLASILEQVQERDIPLSTISHLIFTVSGNDPKEYLKVEAASCYPEVQRFLAGCVIPDHAEFIASIYDGPINQ